MEPEKEPHQTPDPIAKAIDIVKMRQDYQDRIASLPDLPTPEPHYDDQETPAPHKRKQKRYSWQPAPNGYTPIDHRLMQALEKHLTLEMKIFSHCIENTIAWKITRPGRWRTCRLRITKLAKKWGISRQMIHRTLNAMRKKGWLYRDREGKYGITLDFTKWQNNGYKPTTPKD